MNEKQYLIGESLLNAILSKLAECPYKDVFNLVNNIHTGVKPADEPAPALTSVPKEK